MLVDPLRCTAREGAIIAIYVDRLANGKAQKRVRHNENGLRWDTEEGKRQARRPRADRFFESTHAFPFFPSLFVGQLLKTALIGSLCAVQRRRSPNIFIGVF